MKSVLVGLMIWMATASAALAAPWNDTLVPEDMAPWVKNVSGGWLVVGAGEFPVGRDEGLGALIEGLRATPGVQYVLTGSAVGDIVALPDADIVKKASSLPVSGVAIFRLLLEGDQAQGFVALYRKDGTSVGGYPVTRGKRIPQVAVLAPPVPAPAVAAQA